MDDGFTISGLNEGWTLAGAKLMEWVSGFVVAMLAPELLHMKLATSAPLMIIIAIGSTFGLAALRRQFPDEERGIRNAAMVGMGFEPPGIPSPAPFRPFWSGAPVRSLPEKSYFASLGLDVLFEKDAGAEEDKGSIFLKAKTNSHAVSAGSSQSQATAGKDMQTQCEEEQS